MASLTSNYLQAVQERIRQVIVGQDVVIERALIALLSSGHLLLEGPPGLAKTLLVSALSKAVHLEFSRVQFTVDLLPSDIVGSQILDLGTQTFVTQKGPVFTNLLLADEINRATPKVQSALLEAMQERRVTIGGTSYPLPVPFLVIATQNPIEQTGTFELPEAQLDRFMLCHRLEYPTAEDEREILLRNTRLGVKQEENGAVAKTEFDTLPDRPVGSAQDLIDAISSVHQVHVSETFVDHVVELTQRTRSHPALEVGASPRAGISLIRAARARALIQARNYVVPEDLFTLAEDVFLHRIRVSYEAMADGIRGVDVLREILADFGAPSRVQRNADRLNSQGTAK